ncbi:MAG: hypothetical protein ACI8UO_000853 [Verrucomicrobiales bacterium]|jgi:hypothetical protein
MTQDAAEGKEIRRYFPECERELIKRELETQQSQLSAAHPAPGGSVGMLADELSNRLALTESLQIVGKAVEEMKPKAEFADRVADAEGTWSLCNG